MSLPSFPVLVLLLAFVTRVVVRREGPRNLPEAAGRRSSARRDPPVVVLVCMDSADAWREYVNHLVMRCRGVSRIHVLLTYRSADQVPDEDVADPIYRHLVNIEMGLQRSRHPVRNLQRLVRRFVTGSESTVVVLQGGCALHDDFSRTILEARVPAGSVASCPTAHVTGAAQFPTLRVRSNGTLARDQSRPFHRDSLQHPVELVPSVTWCPELTIASGAVLRRWVRGAPCDSFLELVRRSPEVPHLVPSHPLLAHNARVEDDVLDFDEGLARGEGDGQGLSDAERVGITASSSSNERLVKYGTLFRARVAVESVRD